jgi:TfoX/Sxy family transcriptional regulator of competence genes
MTYDPELAARALSALSHHPSVRDGDLVEKKMFGGVSYLLRGAMTVGVLQEDLVIRAAPDDAERYLTHAHVRPMDFTGKPMKGWLYVNTDAVRTEAEMATWVDRAVRFVLAAPATKKTAAKNTATKKTRGSGRP